MTYREVGLWKRTLGETSGAHTVPIERLRSSYEQFRRGVSKLAGDINRELPDFTVHDISHIDALWETAETIAGLDYDVNPLEAYVLGGAFLLHDLGMGLAAWPGRDLTLEGHPLWSDVVAALLRKSLGRRPSASEISNPDPATRSNAIRELLRRLHAEHAEHLADCSWTDSSDGTQHRLIEDEHLRYHLGNLIGRIAHSHWWDIGRVQKEFGELKSPITEFPTEWVIDPLKIACLLRVADAAHLDDRRAPRLLRAARNLEGEASIHWQFQGHLARIREKDGRLVFCSIRPFETSEAEAWWMTFETIQMVNAEVSGVDALLADAHRPRFAARSVAGAENPSRFLECVPARGWLPVCVGVSVGDVARLVERLGGRELYGDDPTVPLRELIQNASDSVRARRSLEARAANWGEILVRLGRDADGPWLEVCDNGVGMSRALLTGTLLDFGESYWASSLCREEHPGLIACGFEPTGKFGIGFFSVFMWGSRVRVISRAHESAKIDTHCLEFSTGLRSRPLLRSAHPKEQLIDGGTVVRVWLKDDPMSYGGLLATTVRESAWGLKELCGYLAPSLDVDLCVKDEFSSGEAVSEFAVRAHDWTTLDPLSLLTRVSGGKVKSFFASRIDIDEAARRLSPILGADGEFLGRACIVPMSVNLRPNPVPSVLTVGGLRAGDSCTLCGVFVGETSRADRMSATPRASAADLAAWLDEQVRRAQLSSLRSDARATIAQVIHFMGGQLDELPVAQCAEGWLTTREVSQRFKEYDELIMLQDAAYSNAKRAGTVVLSPNVIAVASGYLSLFGGLDDRRSRGRDDFWPHGERSKSGRFPVERTMRGVIVRALAHAWAQTEEQVRDLAEMSTDDSPVFREVGIRDGAPWKAQVDVLHRNLVRQPAS